MDRMEKITIRVFKYEAKSAKEFLNAIILASKTAGIHRIINATNKLIDVYFIPGQHAINVDVQYLVGTVSGSIPSTSHTIFDALGADAVEYEYEKYALSRVSVRFTIKNGEELVIWSWHGETIRPLMFVFGGKNAYNRAVEFVNHEYLGNVVIKE